MSNKSPDNSGYFSELQQLIGDIASTSKHTDKTKVIGMDYSLTYFFPLIKKRNFCRLLKEMFTNCIVYYYVERTRECIMVWIKSF
jgi:hypothetical protein